MSVKKIKDYAKRGSYPYPSDSVDPKIKLNDTYALAYCQAMMSDYADNRCEVPFEFGSQYDYETLRRYAVGKQGTARLKENFFGKNKMRPDGTYETKVNVKWDGMNIMPKIFDVLRGINQRIEYRAEIRCVDPDSVAARSAEKEFVKFIIHSKTQELLSKSEFKPSMPVDIESAGLETESDVDLFYDSGASVTLKEIKAEAVLATTKIQSGSKIIQDMNFDDQCTIGIVGVKNYIDKANKVALQRYVDPSKCIIPFSRYPDFRNITRAAEIREMTIGELRKEFPHIKSAQWMKLAKDYAFMNPGYQEYASLNGFFNVEARRTFMDANGMDPVSDVRLPVLDAQWLSLDMEKFLTNKRADGSLFYKDVDYGFEPNGKMKRNGEKVNERQVVKKYFAMWIIGTDIMLDHGVCEDIVYYGPDGNKIPKLDYFFAKTGNESLVSRCIPIVDDIDLAVVKRRNALSMIPPAPRMIIQQQLMDNVFLAGIKQTPEMLIQTLIERGYLIVNNLDDFNKPIFQNSKAIEHLQANVEDITIYTNEINEGIKRIFEVTGLTPAMAASEGNPYDGLGKTELAMNASNNAIYPTFNCYTYMFNPAADDIVKKWQIIAKQNKGLKVSHAPLGVSTMQAMELGSEFELADYNMKVEMVYTEDQKQMLLQQITNLNTAYGNTGGVAGISYAEYMHLFDMIMSGQFKLARFLIAQSEKKRFIAKARLDKETQQMTFDEQRKSAAQAEKLRSDALLREEREKRITSQVIESEKRKTKLVDILNTAQAKTGMVNTNFVQQMIDQTNAEIQNLINSGLQAEQNAEIAEQQQAQNNPQQAVA